MARPSEYDFELCKEICDNVALGSNVISVLDSDERFPAWNTFRRWKNDFAELSAMYVKAQQDKSEACLKEIDDVQQMLKNKEIDPATANVLTQTQKWKASKFYPKMYGTKNDVMENNDEEKANAKKIDITINVKDYSKKDE